MRWVRMFIGVAACATIVGIVGSGALRPEGHTEIMPAGSRGRMMPVSSEESPSNDELVRSEVEGVRVFPGSNTPTVVLMTEDSSEVLLVSVGPYEAAAIVRGLEGSETPRPMTHDLIRAVIDSMGGTLKRVVISRLDDNIFYAELEVAMGEDETVLIDARPSDCMAVAVKAEVPIYIARSVLDKAGHKTGEEPPDAILPEGEDAEGAI